MTNLYLDYREEAVRNMLPQEKMHLLKHFTNVAATVSHKHILRLGNRGNNGIKRYLFFYKRKKMNEHVCCSFKMKIEESDARLFLRDKIVNDKRVLVPAKIVFRSHK